MTNTLKTCLGLRTSSTSCIYNDPWFVEKKDLVITGNQQTDKVTKKQDDDEDDDEDTGVAVAKDAPTVLNFKYVPPAVKKEQKRKERE